MGLESSGVFHSMHGCEWLHQQHSMVESKCATLQRVRSPQIQTETQDRPSPHFLQHLYVRAVSERIEQVCRPLEIRTTFKSRRTLREALVQTKEPQLVWTKRGVVYQIPCAECECVYIGKTGRMLKKIVSKQQRAVKKNDTKNGIAVHAWKTQCTPGSSHSETGEDELHMKKDCWRYTHQKTRSTIQPWLRPAPKPSMAMPHLSTPRSQPPLPVDSLSMYLQLPLTVDSLLIYPLFTHPCNSIDIMHHLLSHHPNLS